MMFTAEKFNILLRLYKVKEGTISEICKKTGLNECRVRYYKDWLEENKIIVYQGDINVHKNMTAAFWIVNHAAIDWIVFAKWKTKVLFQRSLNYLEEEDLVSYD